MQCSGEARPQVMACLSGKKDTKTLSTMKLGRFPPIFSGTKAVWLAFMLFFFFNIAHSRQEQSQNAQDSSL